MPFVQRNKSLSSAPVMASFKGIQGYGSLRLGRQVFVLMPFIFDRHFFVSLLSMSLSGEEILSFKSPLLSYCECPTALLGTFCGEASTVWSHSNQDQGCTHTEWTTKVRPSGKGLPEVKERYS